VYRDADGVLRRVQVYHDLRLWHPAILDEARINNWDLTRAVVQSNRIIFPQNTSVPVSLAVNPEGYFDPNDVARLKMPGENAGTPQGVVRLAKAFEDVRLWHLGLALAAQELGLDLEHAEVDLPGGKIVLCGHNGLKRILPVDSRGRMLISWNVRDNAAALTTDAFETIVARDIQRQWGSNVMDRFAGKLVVIGSTATGNDLADRGATPLEKDTFLTSNHWNVAHSILTGHFIHTCSTWLAWCFIGAMGAAAWGLTARLRVFYAALAVGAVALLYTGMAVLLFVHYQYWLPLVIPVGAGLLTYFSMISYQAVFEQTERRRIRHIFSKIVSPNVVQELLKADDLSLVGSRREVTVLFTDVRGFTAMTDLMQSQIDAYTRRHHLAPEAAKVYSDAQSQEVVQTVNRYLGLIADMIKKYDGTFDKYIGDCVMAFWGAPTPHERHAVDAVRTAIESQRAIYAFNQERALENKRRASENLARLSRGEEPLPMLNLLTLGAGINTGVVTVGLMGSDTHIVNYTVFGREVNLAARLESISGRGHILVGETTYLQLVRDDPDLAATCIPWEPTRLKGFLTPVKIYEVPWQIAKTQPVALKEAA
jgi:class 3 adenylate cyclase